MSLVGSERQGDGLTTIVIITWSMLGGAFMPLSQMPSYLRPFSASTLVYWATDAFNTLMLDGGGLVDIESIDHRRQLIRPALDCRARSSGSRRASLSAVHDQTVSPRSAPVAAPLARLPLPAVMAPFMK